MVEPPETLELLSFTKTIEAASLSRAAKELGVPRATLSRRLARLEEKLGVRLLRRTTRALALTDAGEAFYRHARIILDAVATAEASVRKPDQQLRGVLRISTPPLLDDSFSAMLTEFARAHPLVKLHVISSARHVDLIREGFDLAFRAGDPGTGLVARTLSRDTVVALASPEYLRARGTPKTAEELKKHTCLVAFARGEVPMTHWPLVSGGKVAVEGSLFSNEVHVLADAARRGLGIALLPRLLVAGLLRSGALVPVLEGVVGGENRVSVVYPEKELVPPHVRALIEALVAWAPEGLAADRFAARCDAATSASSRRERKARRRGGRRAS